MSSPGSATPPPPRPGASAGPALDLERETSVFGETLAILGKGPLPIPGAREAAVALDSEGDAVLVVFLDRFEPGTAPATADELDRIAELSEADLLELAEGDNSLAEVHARVHETVTPPAFNRDQRAILVTREAPSVARWREVLIELGRRLSGVFLHDDSGVEALQPPPQITTRAPAGAWKPSTWVSLFAMLLGIAIVLFAITRALSPEDPATDTQAVESPIRLVAGNVSSDVSHTHWINQQHVVRDSRGRLLVLYRSDAGIHLVIDQANQGRSWRAPIEVVAPAPLTFSVAIDGRDNLHIALSDGSSVRYVFVRQSSEGWEASEPLVVDDATTTADVDVAWNDRTRSVQIVWVAEDAGQVISWADVQAGSDASVLQTQELTEAGGEVSALVSVATAPDGTVMATYRKPTETFGWFSRTASPSNDPEATLRFVWASEERLPTDSTVGAVTVAIDRAGVAHVVLRDSSTYKLDYFKRTARGGWTSPEQIVDAESVEEIDFPSLVVDDASKLVYLFFQSNQPGPFTQVHMAVRDPAQGWEGPFALSSHESHPEGASFPMAPRQVQGQPLVFWTRGGASPALEVARVSAP